MIIEDASLAQVAAITARRLDFELPDVVVEEVPTRQYPDRGARGAPVRLRRRSERRAGCADGITAERSIVGQSGIEQVYNKLLMGQDGAKRVVVNSIGREIRTLEEVPPTEGKRLQLTIDYDLQKAVEDGFKAAREARLTKPAPPSCSIRTPARCSRSRASRRTTRTPSRRASTAPRGRR